MEHKIIFTANSHVEIDWDTDSIHDDFTVSPNENIFITWGMSNKDSEKYYLIVFDNI